MNQQGLQIWSKSRWEGARIVDHRQDNSVHMFSSFNIEHLRTALLDCSLCYDVSLSRSDLLGSLTTVTPYSSRNTPRAWLKSWFKQQTLSSYLKGFHDELHRGTGTLTESLTYTGDSL